MHKFPIIMLAAATALSLGTAVPASAVPADAPSSAHLTPTVVHEFGFGVGGRFAENMTSDGRGNLLVSVTTWGVPAPTDTDPYAWTDNAGQVYRVGPDGQVAAFGPEIDLGGYSQLMGVTVDEAGHVFVAVNNFQTDADGHPQCDDPNSPSSGVLRLTSVGTSRVMTLPCGSMPNEVTNHDRMLYVTDSVGGAVWRGPTMRATSPTSPWFSSALLAPALVSPGDAFGLGANGIVYRHGSLYVNSWAQGLILRIRIGDDGRASGSQIFAQSRLLVRADGLSFDSDGRAWVAVDPQVLPDPDVYFVQVGEGSVVTVSPTGRVSVVRTATGSLDYPTSAVSGSHGAVFVLNGSYVYGTPALVQFAG